MAGRPQVAHDGAVARQSRLAGYFGTGLVATQRGPRHAERAARRIRNCSIGWPSNSWTDGWSLKNTAPPDRDVGDVPAIVEASRRSCWRRDPDNRLLARGPRFRVDAEIVRDIALAASGLLNPTVGGPSVYPPAPASCSSRRPAMARRPGMTNRAGSLPPRALHVPLPLGAVPDAADVRAPNGDFSCVRRARSNTPLQALTTLNEPCSWSRARALALRTLAARAATTDRGPADLCLPPLPGAHADGRGG